MLVVIAIAGWSFLAVVAALFIGEQRMAASLRASVTDWHVKTAALERKQEEMQEALRQSREDARVATYELKAEKKKRFDAGRDKTADAPLEAELSQLRSRLVASSDARDAAQREAQVARAERDQMRLGVAELREVLRALGAQLELDKNELLERAARAEQEVLTMRRRLEEQRRYHIMHRSETELLADKLAHVRGRYLHLCGDYVQLMREHPQRGPHNDVFTLSGARELELLRREHEQYQSAQASIADAS